MGEIEKRLQGMNLFMRNTRVAAKGGAAEGVSQFSVDKVPVVQICALTISHKEPLLIRMPGYRRRSMSVHRRRGHEVEDLDEQVDECPKEGVVKEADLSWMKRIRGIRFPFRKG